MFKCYIDNLRCLEIVDMKEKKAMTIVLKTMCIAVLIMICLVVSFFVQFNAEELDSLISTDTLGEEFINGGSVSHVIDCKVSQRNGIAVSKVYQNEMPGLETQFRFRFMRTSLFGYDPLFSDCKLKLTSAEGNDMTHYIDVIFDEIMGKDCMQIIISIPHNEIDKFAGGLIFEAYCISAKNGTYAECKFAIPVEKYLTSCS